MSKLNVKEELRQFVKMVNNIDLNNIVSEGPENCEHNNSSIFYQGIYNSEDSTYQIMAYNKEITSENIKKIFVLSNSNNNRKKGSIGTRGKGIKLIFHKIAQHVDVINISTNGNVERFDFNIKEHMEQVNDVNNNDTLETLHNNNTSNRKYVNFKKFSQDRGIIANIINDLTVYFVKNKLETPKSFIICHVKENLIDVNNSVLKKTHDDCLKIYGIKYNYVKAFKVIMFEFNVLAKKESDKFKFKNIDKIDILGLNNKRNSCTFYIKYFKRESSNHFNDYCIIYMKDQKTKKYKYLLWKPQGREKKPNYEEINKNIRNNYLIEKCKNLKDYDYSINIYRIKKDYWDNQKKILSSNDIPVSKTGVYFLTANDNIILSINPKAWSKYCNKNVGNCDDWGYTSRMVIKIKNKNYFDIRGIKTESDATSETYRIIKNIWNIFKKTKEYTESIKHGNSYNSKINYIDIKEIIKIMLNKNKKHKLEPKSEPKTKSEPKSNSELKSEAESEPKSKSELKSEAESEPKPKTKDGYIYCIYDETRPTLIKMGKSEKNLKNDKERKLSGYIKRYFPKGTECRRTIKVSNYNLAEKLLFERCMNERLGDSEWFYIDKIQKKLNDGLFEGIKADVDKKI